MSSLDSSSSIETLVHNSIEPADHTKQSDNLHRVSRMTRISGVLIAVVGVVILAFSLQYFLFHPMTETDESIGTRLWIVGSWLLGGGVALIFARPWVAAFVAFFSPAFTFAIAMFLYFTLLLLGSLLL